MSDKSLEKILLNGVLILKGKESSGPVVISEHQIHSAVKKGKTINV